jgi:hypothetical protein
MKKPVIRIVARCERHGQFGVDKPGNPFSSSTPGLPDGYYPAVICRKCGAWATIEKQDLVEPKKEDVYIQDALF